MSLLKIVSYCIKEYYDIVLYNDNKIKTTILLTILMFPNITHTRKFHIQKYVVRTRYFIIYLTVK